MKKGRCPKTFWPGLPENLLFRNHFQMLLFCIFNFGYYKDEKNVGILACLDEYLQVQGLTQPTVLTLAWIRGFFLVSASASVVNLLLLYHKVFQVALFHLKYRLHVKSEYSRYKWYYKPPHGQFFIQMIRERTGGHTISAISRL